MFPPGRYGRRRDPARQHRRRWVAWLLAALVTAGGVAIAIKLFDQYAQAPYQVRVITVTNLTDTEVTVTFEVSKPAGRSATCTVLAHTRDGQQVGQATVDIPASAPERSQHTYTLRTTQRPVTGEVPGCGPGR
jgi:hypothetical protein